MRLRFPRRTVLPLAALVLATGARAQDFSLTTIEAPPAAAVDSYAGPSVFTWPRYPGSARNATYVLPMVEVFGHQGWFLSTLAGAGWNFSRDIHWQYGLRLTPQFPRYARDTPQPASTPDIGLRLERGGFLNYCPWEWLSLQTGFRQGSGQRDRGLLLDSGVVAGVPLARHLTLAASASSSWGNSAYTRSYFGVDANAGTPAYLPAAGRVNVNSDIMLLADLSSRWSLTLDLGRVRYLGPAEHSPLTGSAQSHTWFAGAEYHF